MDLKDKRDQTGLLDLLKTALARGAVGFTLRSEVQPVIYFEKGMQEKEGRPSTSQDIQEILRYLVTSREMRQYRAKGMVHFRCMLEGVSLIGGAKAQAESVRVELRKMAS